MALGLNVAVAVAVSGWMWADPHRRLRRLLDKRAKDLDPGGQAVVDEQIRRQVTAVTQARVETRLPIILAFANLGAITAALATRGSNVSALIGLSLLCAAGSCAAAVATWLQLNGRPSGP